MVDVVRIYTLRVPSGKVHLGTMQAGQRAMIRASGCGRWIEDTWIVYEVSPRLAAREVTCRLCAAQAERIMRAAS